MGGFAPLWQRNLRMSIHDFEVTTIAGKMLKLADYRGKTSL